MVRGAALYRLHGLVIAAEIVRSDRAKTEIIMGRLRPGDLAVKKSPSFNGRFPSANTNHPQPYPTARI